MGGEPWDYFTAYQEDINAALQELRQREFKAGRYNPVMPFPHQGKQPNAAAPGAQHATIDEAQTDADADGTRSILDIERIGTTPDYGVACPLSKEELIEHFGTDKPTREMISKNYDLFEDIERGQAIYIIVYKNDKPSEIFFAGYSFD